MRKILFAALLIFAALATTQVNFALANTKETLADWNAPAINWHSYKEGLALAKKTQRPIFIVFQTTWCPHCLNYRKLFFDPDIVKRTKNMVMILVDRDLSPDINKQYGKLGEFVPRTMALNSNGQVIEQIRGAHPKYPHYIDYEDTRGAG